MVKVPAVLTTCCDFLAETETDVILAEFSSLSHGPSIFSSPVI
jgi:hypothetical protein